MGQDDFNKNDEVIEVRLPRRDYENLRLILERERTYSNISRSLKSLWIWGVAGGILSVWALWDGIKGALK